MSEAPVRKISADAKVPGHSTPGMKRAEAIVLDDVWSGTAITDPGVTSGWHHHADHDTVIYVVRGSFEVETATGTTTAHPGDFVHVPAHTVHRETNPSSEQSEVVLVRRGNGPVVVNVDAPAGASIAEDV